MNKIKLRHDNIVICSYFKDGKCSHPRCYRMYGMECMKKENNHGKVRFKKHKHRNTHEHE